MHHKNMEMSSRHLHIFLLTKTAKANNDPLYEKLFTFCMNICYILRLCYIINTARELLSGYLPRLRRSLFLLK